MNKIQKLLRVYGLEKLILNSGSVFLRRIFGMVLSFIWVFIITNLFGSKVYGLIAISQVIISFLGVFFCLGIDNVLVKLGSMKEHYRGNYIQSDFLRKAFVIVVISSFLCGFLMISFKDVLAVQIFKKEDLASYFNCIGLLSILFLSHKAFIGFLAVEGKFNKYGNFYFLYPNMLILILVCITYHYKLPPYFIIIGYILSYGIFGLTYSVSLLRIPIKLKNTISYKKILKLSTPMMISSSFLLISSWTDVLMLGAMVSESDVGVYNAAFKLGSLVLIVVAAVNTVLSPKISKLFEGKNIEGIKKEVQKATKLISFLSLPIVVFMIIFRKPILGLFGEEFISGQLVLVIVSLGMLFNAMSGSVGQILNMTIYQKQFRNFTFICAFTNIILNYFLILKYGIEGAALASLISNLIINIMCLVLVKQKFNFYAFFRL
ncbi:flippase [Winogradskyella luteola]|uniref:Flippase n=1 Tax=Winogradskyella luteola TaxID=2828330 RepID=A0A9X1F812_9FLAO|nr:flippase [Winogradskyella luteola]MBV7269162.1 flippase [Winogradskyella luteola]